MTDRCMWCHCDIGWSDQGKGRVFLRKWIHEKCWDKFRREFKRHYGIDLNHVRFKECIFDIEEKEKKLK